MRTMAMVTSLWVVLLCELPVSVAPAQEASRTDARALFMEANATFQQALAIAPTDKAKSEAMLEECIARWRAISETTGARNSRIELNIANASMLLGDTGPAIVSYRRAQQLAPTDPAVRQGLASARQRVKTHIQTATQPIAWLTAWRAYTSPYSLLLAGGLFWSAAWIGAAARHAGLRLLPRWAAPALAAAALLVVAPLAADEVIRANRKEAVVVSAGVVARNGPSDAVYEPTFNEPLSPGVELTVEEFRADWARVTLPDGRETWVRTADLEVI